MNEEKETKRKLKKKLKIINYGHIKRSSQICYWAIRVEIVL